MKKFKFSSFKKKSGKLTAFSLKKSFPIKVKRSKMNYKTMPSYERSRIGGKKKVNPLLQ